MTGPNLWPELHSCIERFEDTVGCICVLLVIMSAVKAAVGSRRALQVVFIDRSDVLMIDKYALLAQLESPLPVRDTLGSKHCTFTQAIKQKM